MENKKLVEAIAEKLGRKICELDGDACYAYTYDDVVKCGMEVATVKDNEIRQKMENGELFDGTNAFTLPIKDNWISVKKEMPEEKDGVSDTCVVCLGPGIYKMTYTENGVWKHLNRLEQKLVMYWMKIEGPFETL